MRVPGVCIPTSLARCLTKECESTGYGDSPVDFPIQDDHCLLSFRVSFPRCIYGRRDSGLAGITCHRGMVTGLHQQATKGQTVVQAQNLGSGKSLVSRYVRFS